MSEWNNAVDGVLSPGLAPSNEITVLFDDSTLTFPMPAAATMADLAGRLTEEGAAQHRQMLAVTIRLGGSRRLHGHSRSHEGHNHPSRGGPAANSQGHNRPLC